MSSVNKVILIGRLGDDPAFHKSEGKQAIANMSIATSESWKDKATGERKEHTEWHRVVCYGKQAEFADEYFTKGQQVYVEGSLRTREFKDKDGNAKTVLEVIAERIRGLGSKPKETGPKNDDDVPF